MPEDSEPIRSLKTHILNGINDVWIPNLDMIHKVGLFLFPPTNQLKMFSQDEISEIHNFCIEKTMLCNNESDSIEETSHQHQITDDCLFSGLINESNNTTFEEKIKKEISKYSNLIVDYEQQFDVLNWWNNHQSEFKNLYKLMEKTFCVPAGSAASERTFSISGNLITEKRNRLYPNTVNS